MKATGYVLLLIASYSAIVSAQNHIMIEFFPCDEEQPCGGGNECCKFKNQEFSSLSPQFCMSDSQKNGAYEGTYYDDKNDAWNWSCYKSKAASEGTLIDSKGNTVVQNFDFEG